MRVRWPIFTSWHSSAGRYKRLSPCRRSITASSGCASIEPSRLTPAQIRALRLTDHEVALGAGWDTDLLKVELGEPALLDVDLSLTGFSAGTIDGLLNGATVPDDDVNPQVPVAPQTRIGDMWILGDNRVGCGDSWDVEVLQAVIGLNTRFDAAFLDPLYNVRIHGRANAKGRHREFAIASGEMTNAAFEVFGRQPERECKGVARGRGALRVHGLASHG